MKKGSFNEWDELERNEIIHLLIFERDGGNVSSDKGYI